MLKEYRMFAPKQLEDLAKKLFAALPSSLQNLETDIQQQFKEILHATFTRMDLVTRDEFDVQIKVLARTREKIDTLQNQVDALLKEKSNHIN
jgi:ubiquinone biosynthesis accessory factor UbiK